MVEFIRTHVVWTEAGRSRARRTGVALGVAIFSFFLMATRPPAETLYTVRIHDGSNTVELLSEPMTLQKRFLESRIWISRFDRVTPSLSTVIRANTDVHVQRGAGFSSARLPLSAQNPPSEKIVYSKRLLEGKRVKIHSGRSVLVEDNVNLTSQVFDNPRASRDVVIVGQGKRSPKQKRFHLTATAYSPDIRDCWPYKDGITAIGLKAGFGVAAVDPRVIPLGSRIYVEGYGFAIASDLGGAIRGRKIDLCFDTHEEAKVYGRRMVKVYLLD